MIGRETNGKANCITVLIVDDHPLFRDGLQKALELEDDMLILGQATDGEEAIEAARRLHPNVILLDVNLPSMNGMQVARQIKQEIPSIAVVVLTAYHDSLQVLHALKVGASDYCAKDVMPDRLVEIVRAAAKGYYIVDDMQMDARELKLWLQQSAEAGSAAFMSDSSEQFFPLSHRETEILQFVTNGLSNKEIATRLGISQQTVKNHMTSILKKLNVQDRTQAAVTALRRGWVRIQDRG